MLATLRPGRAALMSVSLAALLAGCAGSTSGAPSTPAQPAPAVSTQVAGPTSASVAGPTGGAGDPASAGTTAACTIVTYAAVGLAGGFSVARSSGAAGVCMFQNADSSTYLAVQLYDSQAAMAPLLQIEPSGEHVAGLGDDAFWVAAAGLLFVRKGDHGVEFLDPELAPAMGASATDTSGRDALVTLARSALASL